MSTKRRLSVEAYKESVIQRRAACRYARAAGLIETDNGLKSKQLFAMVRAHLGVAPDADIRESVKAGLMAMRIAAREAKGPEPERPFRPMPATRGPLAPVSKSRSRKRERVADGEFFESREWKRLRYEALQLHGTKCLCCGRGREQGLMMHVDHIKPRSKFPELQWQLSNLQVLCEDCNLGKGAWDQTDWRRDTPPEFFNN